MIPSKSHIFIFFAVFLGLAFHAAAQDRCGTVYYDKLRKQLRPGRENTDQFEQWMRNKLLQSKRSGSERTQTMEYTIPVVVHVIHNGEPVGTGLNLSDAQIISQIDVLNKDYQRLNADAVNTPAEFLPAAGAIDIHFVLAKQDPEGLPTNGIVRVQSTQDGWDLSDNSTFKALSYWPAENYLNIWVIEFIDPTGIIGYAQLPVSSLDDLSNSSQDRLTDGVAIDYRAFGTSDAGSFPDLYPQYNKGRTATHEIGHMLGLYHVWGVDGGCASTDYCADTPIQDTNTNGCPAQPASSCGHHKMFQNYMDYTNDPCMNLFTNNQIDRMVVVLGNSPRRASLLVSPGATDPVASASDLGIRSIVAPHATACPGPNVPSVEVRNYGSNVVSSARIEMVIDGAVAQTKDFTMSLASLDTYVASFSPVNFLVGTSYQVEFHILLTNGSADGKVSNDLLSQFVTIPVKVNIPYLEPFNTLPPSWRVTNPDGLITWANVTAPFGTTTNKAMFMNFYDYEIQGEQDQLITPSFDFTNDTAVILKFDRAYASLSTQYDDQLRIVVTTECDFDNAVEIFNKSGTDLATTSNTSNAFVPKTAADWKTETIALNQFLGHPNVQIAFVANNDYGNNLYLDNVRIETGDFSDLRLVALKTPSPVICVNDPTPVVTLRNNGSTPITDLEISTKINGASAVVQTFSGLQLVTGEDQDFSLNTWSLNNGTNTVEITAHNLLNENDTNPADNTLSINEVVNGIVKTIPLRQNFDTGFPDWTLVSPPSQMNWTAGPTNKKISIAYNAFANESVGEQAWLVSPVLDFSRTGKASMFFDVSYAKSPTGNDHLEILSSTDCGLTFPNVVFDQTGNQLAGDNEDAASWTPKVSSDWKRQYVNLDNWVGNAQARIAFVVTNDHGNNIFIDNVEFFIDDNSNPVVVDDLYSVYDNFNTNFKITFNLPEAETVHLQIFSMLGQVVVDNVLPETLNQTYTVDMSAQRSGIYIVRLQMGDQMGTAKVYVPQ